MWYICRVTLPRTLLPPMLLAMLYDLLVTLLWLAATQISKAMNLNIRSIMLVYRLFPIVKGFAITMRKAYALSVS